jgi:hypothetical protein
MLKLIYISQMCIMTVYCLGVGVGVSVWDLFNVREGEALRCSRDGRSTESRSAGSSGHCASLCSRLPHCSATNYMNGVCEIFTEPPLLDTEILPGNVAIGERMGLVFCSFILLQKRVTLDKRIQGYHVGPRYVVSKILSSYPCFASFTVLYFHHMNR